LCVSCSCDRRDKSSLLPEKVKYEYLVDSVIERRMFKLFGYLWFETLLDAREYVTKKEMTIIGGWHEHN
jgi:hypothetical protein